MRNFLLAIVVFLSATISWADVSFKHSDLGDAQTSNCVLKYATNSCTGAPTITTWDGIGGCRTAGALAGTYQEHVGMYGGNGEPQRICNAACCPLNLAFRPKCSELCPMLGYASGTCEDNNVNITCLGEQKAAAYCDCTGGDEDSIIVDIETQMELVTAEHDECIELVMNFVNENGEWVRPSVDVTVNLYDKTYSGKFYEESDCTGNIVNRTTFNEDALSHEVFYKETDTNVIETDYQFMVLGLPSLAEGTIEFMEP